MQAVADVLELREAGTALTVPAVPEIGDAFERIARGGVGSSEDLHSIRTILHVARTLRTLGAAHRQSHPVLAAALDSAPSLDPIERDLDAAFDSDGTLSDGASDGLRRARRAAAGARKRVIDRLAELTRRYADVLRDQHYDVRDGRYVLPVRADAHIRVEGIVLGSSASGGTLYVEPREVTPVGNRLKVAEGEVLREEHQVLAALSAAVREQVAAASDAHGTCLEADLLAAVGEWARSANARAVLPEDEPVLDLKAMRHPLLSSDERPVVPNDIVVRSPGALVISGPNAGGKTVALKCIGLAAWMARAGIPLPVAEGSRIGWFDPVLTDVGDEQSLARSLSTFSAHVKNLARIIDAAGPHALIVLDEIAGGTDPEEGAALAAAVIETLAERGAAVAVTTHYERLKEFATETPALDNASVAFDFDAMQPTFKLTLGIPGPSSALAVASRYGISSRVLDRARELLPRESLDREGVLGQLNAERQELERARSSAERDAAEQARLRESLEAERGVVREKERARLAREAHDLMQRVRDARAEIARARKKVRRSDVSKRDLRAAERGVDQAASEVAIGSQLADAVQSPRAADRAAPSPQDLLPGARVYVRRLAAMAEVLEPPTKGRVRVAAGAMKLTVALDEIALEAARPKAPPKKSEDRQRAVAQLAEVTAVRTAANTVDLRGLRVDEACSRVDAFLDRMLSEGEQAGFALHGHGTGALKSAIREHLEASMYVDRSRAAERDEGGDAFTVFWLKG